MKYKKYLPAFLTILALLAIALFSSVDFCLFRRMTGLPCPSCGMTRAYLYLIRGDVAGAFLMHPLFPLIPAIAVLLIAARYKGLHFTKMYIAIGVVFLVTYIVRMILLFPHTMPFDYEFNSLIGRLLFQK